MHATTDGKPIVLRFASAADARRDRLPEVARGLIARVAAPLREGETVPARLEIAQEGLALDVLARVVWVTPLARGCLAGLALEGLLPRAQVQLDLLFGVRAASRSAAAARASGSPSQGAALPRLSVALLEPGRVLREVLASGIVRVGRHLNGWDVQLDAVADGDALLAAVAARPRHLAVIDADALGPAAGPLVQRVRARADSARLPLVLLAREGAVRPDRWAVTVHKPIAMKSLLHTAELLLHG